MKVPEIGAFGWKVKKIVSKGHYNYAVVKEHPHATKHGYVLHHRVVMENNLGRLLNPDEVVHHINGDKKDNRIQNLEVLDSRQHVRMHGLERGSKWCELKCPQCSKIFHRERRNTHLIIKKNKWSCCSRKCSGTFSRDIQLNGVTSKVERAISENLVREYLKYSLDNSEETIDNGIRRGHTPAI